MKISEVMKVTGLTKKAINYYENSGLIKPNSNEENNYRDYSNWDVDKLKQIAALRRFGLPVSSIKEALEKPENMYLVFENYMKKLTVEIKNMERCQSILGSCMNKLNEKDIDISKVTEEMSLLKDAVEMSQKERNDFMKTELIRIFPGGYGKMLAISLGFFLEEPLDTKEKEEAWINVVKILDNTESIFIAKELEEYLESRDFHWDKIRNSVTGELDKVLRFYSKGEKESFDFNKFDLTEEQQENLKMFFLYFKKEENMNIILDLLKKMENHLLILSSRYKTLVEGSKDLENNILDENYEDIYENIKEIKVIEEKELKLIGIEYNEFIKKTRLPEVIKSFARNINKVKNICNYERIYGIAGIDSLYKDWNNNNSVFSYILAVQVNEFEETPEGMVSIAIPKHKYLKCTYEGSVEKYQKVLNYIFLKYIGENSLEVDSFPIIDSFCRDSIENNKFKVTLYIALI